MIRISTTKYLGLLLGFLVLGTSLSAQVNIAPKATAYHSSGGVSTSGYGPELYNDKVIPTFGSSGTYLWGWVTTGGYIEYTWTTAQTIDKVIFYYAESGSRHMTTCSIQYWDAKTSSYINITNYTSPSTSSSNETVKFTPVSTTKLRFNNVQGSNPNFREIEVYQSKVGMNNAGVMDLQSPVNFCGGSQNIKVKVGNFGNNRITSYKVNWIYDGVAQTGLTLSSVLIDTAGGKYKSDTVVTLGTKTFSANTSHTLKVWTESPNGVTDTVRTNDTLNTTIMPSLSGTFTVGGTSPNYTTIAAAISDLNKFGICGPVTLDIRAGTYTGQITIKAIAGASATNTITLKGAGKSSTTLTYASTSTTDMATVLLDGADYITIQDMTIANTGLTYGGCVMFTNLADYNTINNCNISVSTTSTSSSLYCIAGTGSTASPTSTGATGNYNTISNNTITGGYYCVTFMGSSTGTGGYAMGNQFLNNSITSYYYMGMYLYYLGESKVIGNKINTTRYTSAYGIYFLYQSNYEMARNEINVPYYGIYSYYTNYYNYNASGTSTTVNNNIFNSSGLYGAYFYYFYYGSFQYNTVRGNSTYAGLFGSALTSDILGNIFWNTSANYAFYSTGGTYTNIDYNIYYAPSAATPIYYNAGLSNLAAWQTAVPAYNIHSYQQDPKLNSSSDLHITKTVTVPYGPNSNWTLDVDGDSRCRFAPTIGADESPLGKNLKPTAGMNGPDTIYVNSPAEFLGNQTPGVPHGNRWYVNGALMKDSTDFVLTIKSTGTYTVKVVAYGCSKSDSVSKTVVVIDPTAAPTVDFVSSGNTLRLGDKVTLTDLSTGGATSWSWDITPKTSYDNNGNPVNRYAYTYGGSTYRNPVVRFDVAGVYKVCLTATNSKGSATSCKVAYIRVLPAYNLGLTTTLVSESEGYIYDNGGPSGVYGNSLKTSMLIAPCASEVYLIVKSFELECGYDYLRIYDGADNKGKVLHPCTGNLGFANGPGLTGLSSTTCTYLCRPATTDTFKALSGKMYLEMATDASGQYNGFEAYYWVKPKTVSAPVADFSFPTTVCVDIPVTFTNKSTGETVQYQWDLDDDMTQFETTSKDAAFAYFAPGKYTITLIASNCGGVDTMQKELTVISPNSPGVSFTADNVNPTTNDIVKFSPAIKECVSEYKWRFTAASGPGKAVFMNGTKATSSNPQVVFTDTGCYTVFLYAKNAGGEDSLALACYIKVKSAYCIPTVTTNIPDIGISEVSITDLDKKTMLYNKSTQGIDDYQNFTPTVSTTLESGVSYDLKVNRTTNLNAATRTMWIDWNLDGDFADAGEKVAEEKNSSALSWTARFTVPTSAKIGASVMRIAINQGNLSNTPCGPNKYGEYEDYRIYVGPFLTPPVITMKGADTVYVEQGYTYTDAGATATSILYGPITVTVKQKPVSFTNMIPGTYMFEYNAIDPAGNRSEPVTRVVIVTPDVTAPKLVVTGTDTTYVDAFDNTYADPQAVLAEDLVDGDLLTEVIKTGAANVSLVGTYTITYKVSDASGNTATITRVIIVRDLVAPVITLIGTDTVYQEVNTAYSDNGAFATDNYCDNATTTAAIIPSGNVNVAEPGTYTIVYNVTDCNGNKATPVIRTVIVQDTKAPVISLKDGKATVTLNVFDTYNDLGAIATDNYGTPAITVSGTFYATFPDGKTNALGTYTIIYTATDKFGNMASVTRTIEVVDIVPPVIGLKGAPTANVCRWAQYNDAGYDVSDNFWKSPDIAITTEGDFVNTLQEGMYSFRYIATDKSGNVAHSEWRIIRVLPAGEGGCTTGISSGDNLENRISVYPNPSAGKFILKVDLDNSVQVSVKVVNALGQTVSVVDEGSMASRMMSIDLSSQASGVYMLYITAGDKTTVKQIVINR
jgi:PKD repeat protein